MASRVIGHCQKPSQLGCPPFPYLGIGMDSTPVQILVVDDEESIRWVIRKTFSASEYNLRFAASAEEATRIVKNEPVEFVLVDINLPGDDGLTFLQQQKILHPELLMAVITGQSTMHNTVTAMKLGAFDFIAKPFDIDEIESLFKRAAQAIKLARRRQDMPQAPARPSSQEDLIIGKSRSVREIYKSIGRVAETDLTVLILGESGTGKELIARAIHQNSANARGPFVAVNCAAIPRDLLEAELFGHEKGAFTGATDRKSGRIETAKNGTLFLDEIGDMSLDLQAKLLRVLQEREFQRVGGLETLRLEARVLAATNQSLLQAVDEARFRRDLYYRVNTFTVQADPLRERREDIPLLADHFLERGTQRLGLPPRAITPEAKQLLMQYDWPGNVRELENVMKSLTIMTRSSVIDVDDLPRNIVGAPNGADVGEAFEHSVLQMWQPLIREYVEQGRSGLLHEMTAHLERPLIRQVLMQTRWNQVKTSEILGINRNTLRTRMAALGIHKPGDE
jgi:two-component system, NtrC family, nitrogen regulation response regulator GlnG